LSIDLSRRERARCDALASFQDRNRDELEAPAADRHAENEELRQAFARALRAVPEPFRTVFVLKEIELLSYEEIARVVGVNTKTVSTRLTRAREHMRSLLRGWVSS
jgi:RNA polymerase sigma-70 factor (ECF subfamily)